MKRPMTALTGSHELQRTILEATLRVWRTRPIGILSVVDACGVNHLLWTGPARLLDGGRIITATAPSLESARHAVAHSAEVQWQFTDAQDRVVTLRGPASFVSEKKSGELMPCLIMHVDTARFAVPSHGILIVAGGINPGFIGEHVRERG